MDDEALDLFEDKKNIIRKEELDNILNKKQAIIIDTKTQDINEVKEILKDKISKSQYFTKYLLVIIYPSHITINYVNPEEFIAIYRMLKTRIVPLTIIRGMKYESFSALILIEYGGYFIPYNLSLDQVENVQNYITSPIFVKSIVKVLSSLRQPEKGYTLSTVLLAFLTGALLGALIFAKIISIF